MKVRFFGVRGSLPTPGSSTARHGGNTPCVQVVVPGTDDVFIIDAGTGIRELGKKMAAGGPKTINLFITHTHWDHIQGFPFFVPIYIPNYTINVFGPQYEPLGFKFQDVLTEQMSFKVFPVRFAELQANISYTTMMPETRMFGKVEVTAQRLNHPIVTLGYSLSLNGKRVVYQSDHEPFYNLFSDAEEVDKTVEEQNRSIVKFAQNADLLIADAMYTPEEYETHRGWGHSSVLQVLERAIAAKAKRVAFFHHEPNHTDEMMDRIGADMKKAAVERGSDIEVIVAAEGMEIDLT